jgi:hypothetical protein
MQGYPASLLRYQKGLSLGKLVIFRYLDDSSCDNPASLPKLSTLANLPLIILKTKSVAPFKKNYSPFYLIYVVFFALSLFKCHCYIFNFRFDPHINISKRRVNFRVTLKSELVVETLCSVFGSIFVLVKCQKVFAALQNLFLSSFQFSQMVILMIVSQNSQTNRGGCSYQKSR